MKYNWKRADTTEGSVRLKELLDSGFVIICKWANEDGVFFPVTKAVANRQNYYESKTPIEFLDPRPDLPELKWGPYDVGEETTTEGIFTYYTKQDYFQVFLQGKLVEFNDELEDGKAALDEWRRENLFAAFC